AAEREEEQEEEVEVEEVTAVPTEPEVISLEDADAEENAEAEGEEEIPDVEDVEEVEDIGDDDEDAFLEEDEEDDENLGFDVGDFAPCVLGDARLENTRALAAQPPERERQREWGHSSVGRALEWHSRGRRFDSVWLHHLPEAAPVG